MSRGTCGGEHKENTSTCVNLQPEAPSPDAADAEGGCFAFSRLAANIPSRMLPSQLGRSGHGRSPLAGPWEAHWQGRPLSPSFGYFRLGGTVIILTTACGSEPSYARMLVFDTAQRQGHSKIRMHHVTINMGPADCGVPTPALGRYSAATEVLSTEPSRTAHWQRVRAAGLHDFY